MDIFVLILTSIIFISLFWNATKRTSKPGEPPVVPHWIPWFGHVLSYIWDPITFFRQIEKKYGPIFTLLLGGKYVTFVLDPFLHAAVSRKNENLNSWLHTADIVDHVFDCKLDYVGLKEHSSTFRNMFLKRFQGVGLDNLNNKMLKNLQDVLSDERYSKREWQKIGLLDFCYKLIFSAGFKTLFTTEESQLTQKDLENFANDFRKFDDSVPPLLKGFPVTLGVTQQREKCWKMFSQDDCHSYVNNFYREYLDTLGCELSELHIVRHCLALLWASESNTCLSAFWLMYYMLSNPKARTTALNQIKTVLKEKKDCTDKELYITRKDMSKMIVLENVIMESFRMSTSSSTMRNVVNDCFIADADGNQYRLRKGDTVVIPYELTHKDPSIHKNPLTFDHSRFSGVGGLEKNKFYKNGKLLKNYLQPFGMGTSACPGQFWAMSVLKQIAILLFLRFDIELLHPNQCVVPEKYRVGVGVLSPNKEPFIRFKLK